MVQAGYMDRFWGRHVARKLVMGNWKMNGSVRANAALLETLHAGWADTAGAQMAVCPPMPFLAQTRDLLVGSSLVWGAQDVSEQRAGAFTGEVSASMLLEFGCRYAIVGHSERRARFQESNTLVAAKAVAARAAGITPVVCIGETAAERSAGRTLEVLRGQLLAVTAVLSPQQLAGIAVAYEPIWAIGSGQAADPATVQEVHAFLRGLLAQADLAAAAEVPILYGGSVKPANAAEYAAQRDVDGALVGGASLHGPEFLAIGAAFAAGH